MKIFKTKEERDLIKSKKLQLQNELLETEVNELNSKYDNELKSYCMIGTYVFIFHKFIIKNGEIYIEFTDHNTPKRCIKRVPYDSSFLTDYDLKELRLNWINFRNNIEKLGLEFNFINKPI